MSVQEFKAWLKGYAEAVGDAPKPDHWKRVLEEADKIFDPGSLASRAIPHRVLTGSIG